MPESRPDAKALAKEPKDSVSESAKRVLSSVSLGERIWISSKEAKPLKNDEEEQYNLAHVIMQHLAVQAPTKHKSGHPGGVLSSFTFAYFLSKRRNPDIDQPLRYSAGHLSLLAYGLQWLFGREGKDKRLQSPQAIIDTFRIPDGLPGHVEAGIGDIPFGTGPLGKGTSSALGAAFGLQYRKKKGTVDILLADGDAQEGQVMEAFRLASHLQTDNLVVHGDFNDIQLSDIPSQTFASDFASMAHACGWHVIEVQHGNDPTQVVAALDKADALLGKGKPIFVCYYTTMGYGIPFMEEGSNTGKENFHGTPLSAAQAEEALKILPDLSETVQKYEGFRAKEKKRYSSPVETDIELTWSLPKSYKRTVMTEKGAARKDFGATHLKNLMEVDDRIVVLHADLGASGGFDSVKKAFPNRVINVGVAEANMYMMAAGMRQVGLLPVTYTFAAFGTNEARANARLIDINCGHTRCGILHDCTHSGSSVGEDGETHQEQNYLNIPFRYTHVWMPGDSNQAAAMAEKGMELISEGHMSVYVFSARSGHEQLTYPDGTLVYDSEYEFNGEADLIRGKGDTSDQVTILATGIAVHDAVKAADELLELNDSIQARVLNVGCIRPIDASSIVQSALETGHIIVVEDHNTEGGLATQVADILADFAIPCTLRRIGLNSYLPSGSADDLKVIAGLDADSIVDAAQDEVRVQVCGGEDIFATCMYELAHNLQHSRFAEQMQDFVSRLLLQPDYIQTLRSVWKKRACPKDQIPTNAALVERLKENLSQ